MNTPERELTDWILENALLIFGEEVKWYTLPNLNADLLGTDKNGNSVIVEVKWWDDKYPSNRDKQEYQSIGQILHYANIFQKKHPDAETRLFIIASSTSQKIEACCEYLRLYGFNIQHLSKLDTLEKQVEEVEKALSDALDRSDR